MRIKKLEKVDQKRNETKFYTQLKHQSTEIKENDFASNVVKLENKTYIIRLSALSKTTSDSFLFVYLLSKNCM